MTTEEKKELYCMNCDTEFSGDEAELNDVCPKCNEAKLKSLDGYLEATIK